MTQFSQCLRFEIPEIFLLLFMLTLGPRLKIFRIEFLIIHRASAPFLSAKKNGEWRLPFVLTTMLLDIFSLLNRIPSLSLLAKRQTGFFIYILSFHSYCLWLLLHFLL